MTALYTILTILELVFTVKGLPPITCPSDSDCTINCDTFDPINGCAARTIDASYSLSLNVLCSSSQNPFTGGCQYADLICPTSSNSSNSSCNIQCSDYYGCYYTTVHSDMTDEVTLECSEETGSCLHTILYANYSNNVNLSCASNSCDQLQIYAENVMNGVHLSCDGEYACSDIDLYVNTAHNVDVFARGSYALFSSYIYADDADHLHLLCAGKQSEYACYKTFIFPPKHESSGSPGSYIAIPRAQIECQGHGCKDELYFYSKDGALDLDISLNSCTECDDASDCIDNWYFYCDYLTFDTFTGDSCGSDDCNCESAADQLDAQSTADNFNECELFDFDHECEGSGECVIDCSVNGGCVDTYINGNNASSLHVICSGTHHQHLCESAHIYCPFVEESHCVVDCLDQDSCLSTTIIVVNPSNATLNLTCSGLDACTQTSVYGEHNSHISANCVSYHACNSMAVVANDANNINILCDADSPYSSYSACNELQLFGLNVKNEIELICAGDHTCYHMDIHANYSNSVIVDTIGDYASYYGNVFAQNAGNMFISCKARYSDVGCYYTNFYVSSEHTSVECEGHGCYSLKLYSLQGFTDIKDISVYGCDVCTSMDDCINSWRMYCGSSYSSYASWYGGNCYDYDCNCRAAFGYAYSSYNASLVRLHYSDDIADCEILRPDTSCANDQDCIVECTSTDSCEENIIMGNNATSLAVNCADSSSCEDAKIYCPDSQNSECNVLCDGYEACRNAVIYGSQNGKVNISCAGTWGCAYSGLFINDVSVAHITCSGSYGCYQMDIEAVSANNITLDCVTSGYSGACRYASVHVDTAKDATINCIGSESCEYIDIYGDNARNVSIYAIGIDALEYAEVYVKNASNSMLTCASNKGDGSGCGSAKIYLPQNDYAMRIKCIGFGCDGLNFYSQIGMEGVVNISLNGDYQCIAPELCIDEWDLYCGSSYYSTQTEFTGSQCVSDECHCNDLKSQIAESWEMGTGTIVADITCAPNQDCVVTSSSIPSQAVIYGAQASSLSVECTNYGDCQDAQIYCPETINSFCSITCGYYSSCNKAVIIAYPNTTLDINAISSSTFTYGTIWAPDVYKLNLYCYASDSCDYASVFASDAYIANIDCASSACSSLNVFASNVRDTVSLKCSDQYACSSIKLYANNANNVSVLAANGYHALYNGYIHAYNASNLDVTCIGESTSYGCYDANIYFPTHERTTLNCYGYGCYGIDAYLSDVMNSVTSIQVLLYGCELCGSSSSCISSSWSISCSLSYADDYSYYHCHEGAGSMAINFTDSVTSHCLSINTASPTQHPISTAKPTANPTTATPTTSSPTARPTVQPSVTVTEAISPLTTMETQATIETSEYESDAKVVVEEEEAWIDDLIDQKLYLVIVAVLSVVILVLIGVVSVLSCCKRNDKEPIPQEDMDHMHELSTTGAAAMERVSLNATAPVEEEEPALANTVAV
eukprot:101352_1